MIVLDASVLIAHLDAADVHHQRATAVLIAAAADGEDVAASPITLAEVLVGPARAGRLQEGLSALRQLGVGTVDLPSDAPAQLAELRASAVLKLPDCCVLLAARQGGAALATFDTGLATAASRAGVTLRPA